MTEDHLLTGFRAQQALAREGLAPAFFGATRDPERIHELTRHLPRSARTRISTYGGVWLVTLNERIPQAQELNHLRHWSLRQKAALFHQIARAEKILRREHITPVDDRAVLTFDEGEPRLWLIHFEEYRPGSQSDLSQTRNHLNQSSSD